MNKNYTYFLSDRQEIYFLACRRTLVISVCVPWDEKVENSCSRLLWKLYKVEASVQKKRKGTLMSEVSDLL